MHENCFLTILTPTYNRGVQLHQLFGSLMKQSDRGFVWLIVDDGSKDDTEAVVKELTEKADFNIEYIHKLNGGKHTALNVGIPLIDTPLTFIVDSDDWLTENAVRIIRQYYRKYKSDTKICGYSFLRQFPDGKINGNRYPSDEWVTSYLNARINSGDDSSDKAEVFNTKCLQEFPFPEYPGERFLGEDIVWMRMSRKYSTVHINQPIYVGDYQEDGLTTNRRKNNIQSPNGCMERAKEFMGNEVNLKVRTKATIQYIVYGGFAGKSLTELLNETDHKLSVLIMIPAAQYIYRKWKKQYV